MTLQFVPAALVFFESLLLAPAALLLLALTPMLESAPFTLLRAQRPLLDIRPLFAPHDGVGAGLVFHAF